MNSEARALNLEPRATGQDKRQDARGKTSHERTRDGNLTKHATVYIYTEIVILVVRCTHHDVGDSRHTRGGATLGVSDQVPT